MNHHETAAAPVQMPLAFIRDDIWQRLPKAQQNLCRQLLMQLLCAVVRREASERGDDER